MKVERAPSPHQPASATADAGLTKEPVQVKARVSESPKAGSSLLNLQGLPATVGLTSRPRSPIELVHLVRALVGRGTDTLPASNPALARQVNVADLVMNLIFPGLELAHPALEAYRGMAQSLSDKAILRAIRLARLSVFSGDEDYIDADELLGLERQVYGSGDSPQGEDSEEQSPDGQSFDDLDFSASAQGHGATKPRPEIASLKDALRHFFARQGADSSAWLSGREASGGQNPAWFVAPFGFSWDDLEFLGFFRALIDRERGQSLCLGADFSAGEAYYALNLRANEASCERLGGWAGLNPWREKLGAELSRLGFRVCFSGLGVERAIPTDVKA
jgi:hypothetical protein